MKKLILAITLTALAVVFTSLFASCDKQESTNDSDTMATSEKAESESSPESETESETESDTETETETESDTETSKDSETEKTPATPSDDPVYTEDEIVIGSGGSSGNSSNNSSGTKETTSGAGTKDKALDPGDGYGLNTTTGGRIHTYASAPALDYEDTSNTLPFMPIRQEGATDPHGIYNRPSIAEKDIAPGLIYNGGETYSTTYVGYDGFLFCEDTMADYDGTSLYTSSNLESVLKNMKKRNDWVEEQGKKMYIVFIPNKNSVYPEYMPEGYPMGSYRRIDQVIEGLRGIGISVVDGRESLLAAKAANPQRCLYYKTDTHWNNHGGFIVYQQLMNEIKKDYPNVVVHQKSEYQINYAESYMKDQTYYIGYYDATSEPGPVYTLKSGLTATFTYHQQRDRWGQFQFTYQWPNGYSDHLYYFKWRNDYNTSAPSMYMLRDSYSIAMTNFLKDSFYESTYNWTFNFSKSDILKSGADIIICEVVEKNIQNFLWQYALGD